MAINKKREWEYPFTFLLYVDNVNQFAYSDINLMRIILISSSE
ncbi:hypothetical protein SAMN05660236_3509 [Ohtaekwangia koreensis]|uniref:Uncharacterized protein n=1 Tax=Ohtaekwangia koreensis TaxID=688867 RepID=A0A1T5LNH4_9BACT|nr:hypothetical protein SAMN05660236_3509 [Ohtaekwangia koreensis]